MRTTCPLVSFLLLVSCFFVTLDPGNSTNLSEGTIKCPYGTDVIIDGTISPNEWDDAGSMDITVQSQTWNIRYMHTEKDLLIAYDHPAENMMLIYLDVYHDAASYPATDDLHLHSSLSDFEQRGTGSGWGDYILDFTGWEVATDSDSNTREVRINFTRLSITVGHGKTLGICFGLKALDWTWETYWPPGSDPNDPSTWGDISSPSDWSSSGQQNHVPGLTSHVVSPKTGNTLDDFIFSIEYLDLDGDMPVKNDLVLSGEVHEMISEGTDPEKGIEFHYTCKLPKGKHEYHFEFSDGSEQVRFPATGSLITPEVLRFDEIPETVNGGIPSGCFHMIEDEVPDEPLFRPEVYFEDDHDNGQLRFEVFPGEEDGNILVEVSDGNFIVNDLTENWHGREWFRIECRDLGPDEIISDDDGSCMSSYFDITVVPRNDPPRFERIDGERLEDCSPFTDGRGIRQNETRHIVIDIEDPDLDTDENEKLNLWSDDGRIEISSTADSGGEAIISIRGEVFDVGTHIASLKVSDSQGATDSYNISFEVLNVNEAPIIRGVLVGGSFFPSNDGSIRLTAFEDRMMEFRVEAEDPDMSDIPDEILSLMILDSPPDLEIFVDNDHISFTPLQEHVGTFKLEITVRDKDGLGSEDTLTLTVDVIEVNDPPILERLDFDRTDLIYEENETVLAEPVFSDNDFVDVLPYELFSFIWSSDIQGVISTERVLSTMGLLPGIHSITVKIIDENGGSDSKTVKLKVEKPSVEGDDDESNDNETKEGDENGNDPVDSGPLYIFLFSFFILLFISGLIFCVVVALLAVRRRDDRPSSPIPAMNNFPVGPAREVRK